MAKFPDELTLLVRARYPLIYVVSHEEERVDRWVREIGKRLGKNVYEWTSTGGFARSVASAADARGRHGGEVEGELSTREPAGALDFVASDSSSALFVLHDFHAFLTQPEVVRRLRDLVSLLRRSLKTVILLAPCLTLPVELEKDAVVVDVPLPDASELLDLLDRFLEELSTDARFSIEVDGEDKEGIARAACGLTEAQAWRVFARAAVDDRRFVPSEIDQVLTAKKQEIRKSGILEYHDLGSSLKDVGGLDGLKRWLLQRRDAFGERARAYGLPPPRGVLLLGVQGCGKSLAAKSMAAELLVPLLRMDVGRIFSSFVGASEENMRRAIRLAEALAPVVLWIDELEKGFAGSRSGGTADAGASMRVFATLLTWLQERTSSVFVVATANQIRELPPELLRKGRFDEIFFVDLPEASERQEIFTIHLANRGRDPAAYDLPRLVAASDRFSGAELEQSIIDGMYYGFAEDREFDTGDVLRAIEQTVPLSQTMEEDIATLRAWARTRARPAAG